MKHYFISESTIQTVTVPFKSKLTVRCESWFLTQFAILDSCMNRESRIKHKLSRIKSRIKSRRTENKRLTHDWFLNNFTKTYSCNTAQHGYIRASDCMLGKRPIQVVKRMFHQGYLYQASFPPVKFKMPAPNANSVHSCTSPGGTPIWKGRAVASMRQDEAVASSWFWPLFLKKCLIEKIIKKSVTWDYSKLSTV